MRTPPFWGCNLQDAIVRAARGRAQAGGGRCPVSAQESANQGGTMALTGRALADETAEGVLARAEGLPALAARPAAVAVAGAIVLLQLALQAHLPRRPTR